MRDPVITTPYKGHWLGLTALGSFSETLTAALGSSFGHVGICACTYAIIQKCNAHMRMHMDLHNHTCTYTCYMYIYICMNIDI